MRFGYWLPVFGGWLRNVDDERMAPTWDYVKTLARQSEDWGYDLTLIAELNLNDQGRTGAVARRLVDRGVAGGGHAVAGADGGRASDVP
jgi:hypothetical protein